MRLLLSRRARRLLDAVAMLDLDDQDTGATLRGQPEIIESLDRGETDGSTGSGDE